MLFRSDKAAVNNWTGKCPENGVITSSSTLAGFVTSGYPHSVEFFPPDADIDKSKPEFTVPFVISIPEINIEFGEPVPTFKEVVGKYSNGQYTITEAFISDKLKKELESNKNSGDGNYECDLSEMQQELEGRIGTKEAFPFSISKKKGNKGTIVIEESQIPITYDKNTGVIVGKYTDESGAGNHSP